MLHEKYTEEKVSVPIPDKLKGLDERYIRRFINANYLLTEGFISAQQIIDGAGTSKEQVSRVVGSSANRKMTDSFTARLCHALSLPEGWFDLVYTVNEIRAQFVQSQELDYLMYRLTRAPKYHTGQVPSRYCEPYKPPFDGTLSDAVFLVKHNGIEMESRGSEKSLRPGEYLIFEPDIIPRDQDVVVARVTPLHDPIVRLYTEPSPERQALIAIGDYTHPEDRRVELTGESEILGVMIGRLNCTLFHGLFDEKSSRRT